MPGSQIAQMNEKPQLVIKTQKAFEPIEYQCSLCDQRFILPEDRSPKEAVAEIWSAFKRHIQDEHAE